MHELGLAMVVVVVVKTKVNTIIAGDKRPSAGDKYEWVINWPNEKIERGFNGGQRDVGTGGSKFARDGVHVYVTRRGRGQPMNGAWR